MSYAPDAFMTLEIKTEELRSKNNNELSHTKEQEYIAQQ